MNRSCKLFAVILSCAVAAVTLSGCNTVKLGDTSYDKTVSGLNLNGKGLTNTDIANIGKFENVTYLDLRGNFITDLSFLSDMTGLQQLYLDSAQINNVSAITDLSDLREIVIETDTENMSVGDYNNIYAIKQAFPSAKINPDLSDLLFGNAKLVYESWGKTIAHVISSYHHICLEGFYYGNITKTDQSELPALNEDIESREETRIYLEKCFSVLMGGKCEGSYYIKVDAEQILVAVWSPFDITGDGQTAPAYSDGIINGCPAGFYPSIDDMEKEQADWSSLS